MPSQHRKKGFTLIEMMIVMAIMAILGAIAIPIYSQFVREAEMGTARMNMDSLRTFLEDFFLDNNTFVGTTGNWTANETDTSLRDNLGWEPSGDGNQYNYFVVGEANTYSIVVENPSAELWIRCEDRMDNCCSSETPGAVIGACP